MHKVQSTKQRIVGRKTDAFRSPDVFYHQRSLAVRTFFELVLSRAATLVVLVIENSSADDLEHGSRMVIEIDFVTKPFAEYDAGIDYDHRFAEHEHGSRKRARTSGCTGMQSGLFLNSSSPDCIR